MTTTTARRYGLGRIARFDEKSRNYPARTAAQRTSVVHTHYGPMLDQGEVGSCSGNGQAQASNTKGLHRPRTGYKTEPDAVQCYTIATSIDPYPGTYPQQDTGSSVLAATKAAVQLGWATRYEWAFGLDHMQGAVGLGTVEVGVNWYESFFKPSRTGYIDISGDIAGGHAFAVNGVNFRDRFFWALQSWGPDWGLGGRFKIPFAVMDRLLREDGECVRPIYEAAPAI
jgi:hypothetical protein